MKPKFRTPSYSIHVQTQGSKSVHTGSKCTSYPSCTLAVAPVFETTLIRFSNCLPPQKKSIKLKSTERFGEKRLYFIIPIPHPERDGKEDPHPRPKVAAHYTAATKTKDLLEIPEVLGFVTGQ
eukprot:1352683-Amorphochlora_amoeboformis.AAC.2